MSTSPAATHSFVRAATMAIFSAALVLGSWIAERSRFVDVNASPQSGSTAESGPRRVGPETIRDLMLGAPTPGTEDSMPFDFLHPLAGSPWAWVRPPGLLLRFAEDDPSFTSLARHGLAPILDPTRETLFVGGGECEGWAVPVGALGSRFVWQCDVRPFPLATGPSIAVGLFNRNPDPKNDSADGLEVRFESAGSNDSERNYEATFELRREKVVLAQRHSRDTSAFYLPRRWYRVTMTGEPDEADPDRTVLQVRVGPIDWSSLVTLLEFRESVPTAVLDGASCCGVFAQSESDSDRKSIMAEVDNVLFSSDSGRTRGPGYSTEDWPETEWAVRKPTSIR